MNVRLFKPSVGSEELESIKEIFDRVGLGLLVNFKYPKAEIKRMVLGLNE